MAVGNRYLWKDSIVNKEDVSIELFDRGYTFGDGIYEVIRIYNGNLFTAEDHINRLFYSADRIEMNLNKNFDEVIALVKKLIAENELKEGYVYLQVTRGDEDPRNHGFRFFDEQVSVLSGFVIHDKRSKNKNVEPVNAITTEDLRGKLCDVKSLNLLPNVVAMHQAQKLGARKAILVKDNNIVTEEKSGNVIIIKDGKAYTHPDGVRILPGITKKVVKKICEMEGIEYIEEAFMLDELYNADEVLVVDTNSEIVAISKVDDRIIGDGSRGFYAEKFQSLYEKEIIKECGSL